MIVAVVSVLIMEMRSYEIIVVVAVGYRFVSAVRTVAMLRRVSIACVIAAARCRLVIGVS